MAIEFYAAFLLAIGFSRLDARVVSFWSVSQVKPVSLSTGGITPMGEGLSSTLVVA